VGFELGLSGREVSTIPQCHLLVLTNLGLFTDIYVFWSMRAAKKLRFRSRVRAQQLNLWAQPVSWLFYSTSVLEFRPPTKHVWFSLYTGGQKGQNCK
jgi:hypothetical protein